MARFEAPLQSVLINSVEAGAGDVTGAVLIAAPGVGKKIRVHSYMLQGSAATILHFRTATAGGGAAVGRAIQVGSAGQGGSEGVARPDFVFELPENTPLVLRNSAAATITGGVTATVVRLAAE
jgi:hypothetical protein